jgi:hypothetical protein
LLLLLLRLELCACSAQPWRASTSCGALLLTRLLLRLLQQQ